MMNGRRTREEWHNAIISIIRRHGGHANYDNFYIEIPEILGLTGWERRLSTKGTNYEPVWRGTLRGYLSHMVQDGILTKQGPRNKRIFSENKSQTRD